MTRHLRPLPILAALLTACTGAPVTPDAPNPPTPSAPEPPPQQAAEADPATLDFCEGLFATLNELQPHTVSPELRDAAEAQARAETERCRAAFVAAADTPGARAIAEAFADLMLLRAYDLRMDRRQDAQDTREVCPDSLHALERIKATLAAVTTALDTLELTEIERGVLTQIQASMVQKVDALEPFALRGCHGGAFDPRRMISVDDLAVTPGMTWDTCYDIVIAFSAFDVEAAERKDILALIALLEAAGKPCRAVFAPDPRPAHVDALKGHAYAALLDGAPLLVKTSLAFAEERGPDACQAIGDFLRLNEDRVAMLTDLVRADSTDVDTRNQAAHELEAEGQTRRALQETFRVMCAL